MARAAAPPALAPGGRPEKLAGAAGPGRGPRSRSREPRGRGPGQPQLRLPEDSAPYWQRNLEAFVQLNDLDERSSKALAEMPKALALQVMGLVGRENSYVIRGARNPSAAVMHRLQRAQEGAGGTEPYAQLANLLEDFIAVNGFDERGAEALRSMRPEAVLHVMGFTAENAFLIAGVRNPSAALMARIGVAQRLYPSHQQ